MKKYKEQTDLGSNLTLGLYQLSLRFPICKWKTIRSLQGWEENFNISCLVFFSFSHSIYPQFPFSQWYLLYILFFLFNFCSLSKAEANQEVDILPSLCHQICPKPDFSPAFVPSLSSQELKNILCALWVTNKSRAHTRLKYQHITPPT